MSIQTFSFPTSVFFGPGSRHRVAELLDEWGEARPLLITHPSMLQAPALLDLVRQLDEQGREVRCFAGVGGVPRLSQIREAGDAFTAHRADSIVAVGGGAAMGVAKSVAVWVRRPELLCSDEGLLELGRPGPGVLPQVLVVPTTAGSGVEVGRTSTYLDDDRQRWVQLRGEQLTPTAAVLDPELSLDQPAEITARSAIVALASHMEAFLAPGFNPLCDGIALEGVRLIAQSLMPALRDPRDPAARGRLMSAALMGSAASQKGLGMCFTGAHVLALAWEVTPSHVMPPLLLSALRLEERVGGERLRRLAVAAGLEPSTGVLSSWLCGLLDEAGLAPRLEAARMDLSRLTDAAQQAVELWPLFGGGPPPPVGRFDEMLRLAC